MVVMHIKIVSIYIKSIYYPKQGSILFSMWQESEKVKNSFFIKVINA